MWVFYLILGGAFLWYLLGPVGFWLIVILGIAAIVGFIIYTATSVKKEQEHDALLNDPNWVKQNPGLARTYAADKKKRDDAAYQRDHGPAVSINNLRCGWLGDSTYGPPTLWTGSPDSAGGWDVGANIVNISSHVIKYVTITVTPINAVGDPCVSSVPYGRSTMNLNYTGPLYVSQTAKNVYWSHCWYDCPIHHLRIDEIKVTLMNGTVQTLDGNGKLIS